MNGNTTANPAAPPDFMKERRSSWSLSKSPQKQRAVGYALIDIFFLLPKEILDYYSAGMSACEACTLISGASHGLIRRQVLTTRAAARAHVIRTALSSQCRCAGILA